MRILVTGANGSVGRELAPALLARGRHVVAMDKELEALRAASGPRLELVSGAIEDAAAVEEASRESEVIIHLAWSFGEEIGGRHLRDMLKTAAAGQPVQILAHCGGSFLSMEDFIQAVELILLNARSFGQIFNVASAYVTWEEVARMTVEITGSSARVDLISPAEWTGAAFLADWWELDDRKIRERPGFKPACNSAGVREALRRAIARTWQQAVA